jgi:hypothetical protein
MNWFVHDSSLVGQYQTQKDFLAHIESLLRLRVAVPIIRERLKCSRSMGERLATATQTFRQTLLSCPDRTLRRLALDWIDSRGPFLDEDTQIVPDNYFEYLGVDVTNEGAGEAARRLLNGADAATYSFEGGGSDYTPLPIDHGVPEDRFGTISVQNFWSLVALRDSALTAVATVTNWEQAISYARLKFPGLLFSDNLLDFLKRETFTVQLVENIFTKLSKLQEFVDSRNADGTNSEHTDRLISAHFSGEKTWFTDESDTNKRKFAEQLTFIDPLEVKAKIFCPFHGKIKTPQYRIHFPWPLVPGDKRLRIVYIGPKITKD